MMTMGSNRKWLSTVAMAFALPLMPVFAAMAQPSSGSAADGVPNLFEAPDVEWAKLPAGQSWGNVIGVQQAPNGEIVILHRCFGKRCIGRPEDPIRIFDANGNFRRSFGAGLFVRPHGLWVDRNNNIWVSDGEAQGGLGSVVIKFDGKGKKLLRIGTPGQYGDPEHGMLTEPNDIITNARGDIYISEGHGASGDIPPANRISIFSRDGRFIRSFGKTGGGPAEFRTPHALAFDGRGRLFVADRENNRIQILTPDGRFIAAWPQFGRPSGIDIDRKQRLYVTDSESAGDVNPGFRKGMWVGDARTGERYSFSPDPEIDTPVPSGAEGIGADRKGNIIGAVVRRSQVAFLRKKKPLR